MDAFAEDDAAVQSSSTEGGCSQGGEATAVQDEVAVAAAPVNCDATEAAYVAKLGELQDNLKNSKELSSKMAEALAEIDPNMDNAAEGTAFIRRMYKIRNKQAPKTEPSYPQTPSACVEDVAGKVIQIEDLSDQIAKANSFRNFFAHVYCAAYVNALVTMQDGLYQIFPGGLDSSIAEELQRLYGPLEQGSAELDQIEIASVEAYFDAVMHGDFEPDESSLIQTGEPLAQGVGLCAANISDDIMLAQQDREDYLNDLNFLNFLKTL